MVNPPQKKELKNSRLWWTYSWWKKTRLCMKPILEGDTRSEPGPDRLLVLEKCGCGPLIIPIYEFITSLVISDYNSVKKTKKINLLLFWPVCNGPRRVLIWFWRAFLPLTGTFLCLVLWDLTSSFPFPVCVRHNLNASKI